MKRDNVTDVPQEEKTVEEKVEELEREKEEEEVCIETSLQTNKLRCAELLLLRGVNPNKQNDEGQSALLLAAMHGGRFHRIAQMVMGVPPNAAIDDHGSDDWWTEHGHSFTNHGNSQYTTVLDLPDHNGITPLLWAAREGNADILEELLAHGLHSHHHSAVHHSRRGSTDATNLTHSRADEGFADEDWVDRSGRTALMWASIGLHDACAKEVPCCFRMLLSYAAAYTLSYAAVICCCVYSNADLTT
jgi:ankyrin repeat protein